MRTNQSAKDENTFEEIFVCCPPARLEYEQIDIADFNTCDSYITRHTGRTMNALGTAREIIDAMLSNVHSMLLLHVYYIGGIVEHLAEHTDKSLHMIGRT